MTRPKDLPLAPTASSLKLGIGARAISGPRKNLAPRYLTKARSHTTMSGKPGLAKTSPLRVFSRKEREFVRLSEGQMRDWLLAADIMSEGREERTATTANYFGTTSILLPWAKAVDSRLTFPSLFPVLASDPHLRVRVLRIARQEAETRASSTLDTIRAEISCRGSSRGLLFLIDLEAPVRVAGLGAAR